MKRFWMGVLLAALIVFPSIALADGSCTQEIVEISRDVYEVKFVCTGDASDGSIPNTETSDSDKNGTMLNGQIRGMWFTEIKAYPTSGGTAPDAASVFVLDEDDLDLLGSEDGSTTAYAGLNLIHATLPRKALPNLYLPRAGSHVNYYHPVKGPLTIKVIDQDTASANYTLVLTFER